MGLFNVGCRVENHKDAKKSAEISVIMVDTGSMHTWIAEGTLRKLGIKPVKQVESATASGQIMTRTVGFAVLRSGEFETADEVVFAQRGDSQCLGWRALSGMNARVDGKSKRLVDAGPVVAAANETSQERPPRKKPDEDSPSPGERAGVRAGVPTDFICLDARITGQRVNSSSSNTFPTARAAGVD